MINELFAEKSQKKYQGGGSEITDADIFLTRLKKILEQNDINVFYDELKQSNIKERVNRQCIIARLPALLLNNYFIKELSQNEYNNFTKETNYWDSKVQKLKEYAYREQWQQFQNLIELVIWEQKNMSLEIKKCAEFYEWLDKYGHYKYVEQYEKEENSGGILCHNGYLAFCDWLERQGRNDLMFQYEKSKN